MRDLSEFHHPITGLFERPKDKKEWKNSGSAMSRLRSSTIKDILPVFAYSTTTRLMPCEPNWRSYSEIP